MDEVSLYQQFKTKRMEIFPFTLEFIVKMEMYLNSINSKDLDIVFTSLTKANFLLGEDIDVLYQNQNDQETYDKLVGKLPEFKLIVDNIRPILDELARKLPALTDR